MIFVIININACPDLVFIFFISIIEGNEDPKSRSGTPAEIPIVPAGSSPEDNICPICHEEFDQFYKQDFADISSSEGKFSKICGIAWKLFLNAKIIS